MKNLNLVPYCSNRLLDIEAVLLAARNGKKMKDTVNIPTAPAASSRRKLVFSGQERRRTTSYFKYAISRSKLPSVKRSRLSEESRCRKHRRRPRYILQKENVLGTHLYNAKTMRIVLKWGLKIPKNHSARGISSIKNILKENCSLADRSYYRVLDIEGDSFASLTELLSNFTVI